MSTRQQARRVGERRPQPEQPQQPERSDPSDPVLTAVRSYRYLRASMVGVLVALAVAVGYQSLRQHDLLASISAYYYTPAQGIFVGALIGLGVAMIALKGTNDFEDVVLNLGGMLAPVIAVVPTSRGEDFRAAVRACRIADATVLTARAPSALDCPTVRSLTGATKANVENNMVALLVAGGLALLTTLLFAWVERRTGTASPGLSMKLLWGMGLAAALYLLGLVAFWAATPWFVDHAHYYAATGLFTCIVLVVVANAVRKNKAADREVRVTELARREGRWYLYLAVTMVLTAGVLAWLVLTDVITLFWLEAALIGLFAVFWVAQTWEQWNPGGRDKPSSRPGSPRQAA